MMSVKLANTGLLKITVFGKDDYDEKNISAFDVTNNLFIMWLKSYCRCGDVTKVSWLLIKSFF